MKTAMDELRTAAQKIGELMYQQEQAKAQASSPDGEPQGQPEGEPAGTTAGERKSDDTIEGEFKEQS
jgi:hypothetical protein